MAASLPRLIVIKSTSSSGGKGNVYYKDDGGVLVGEESVLSTVVKIEAEQAKKYSSYVHLRFCYSNKYWQRKENERSIVAISGQAQEDTRDPSCTLFEPKVDGSNGLFYLIHVQSGLRVSVDESTAALYLQDSSYAQSGNLSIINWDTLVKLPENVAFKGYNKSWLGGILSLGVNYLQFSVDDPNTPITTYKIQPVADGHVRIFSNYFNRYCRRSDYDWIAAESSDASADDVDTLFWPSKIDDATIALRSAGNGNFCIGLDAYDKTRCLNAAAPNITNAAHISVQELVSARRIYNVRYRMEDARVYKETPFVAGTTTAYNYGDNEDSVAVEVSYEDSKSHSFTRGLTITAGVKSEFEVGVPLIVDEKIEVSFEVSGSFEWNDTTTTTTSVKATGTVSVPPKSKAIVHYVGTMGTCDVPFSYTQEDTSSTDGRIIVSDLIDGIFTGVNAYNFSFVVDKTEPLN